MASRITLLPAGPPRLLAEGRLSWVLVSCSAYVRPACVAKDRPKINSSIICAALPQGRFLQGRARQTSLGELRLGFGQSFPGFA
jgi:hypothetical protein